MVDKCLAEDSEEQEPSCSDDDACCVCLSRVATVRAYPCGHKISCRLCATLMLKVIGRSLLDVRPLLLPSSPSKFTLLTCSPDRQQFFRYFPGVAHSTAGRSQLHTLLDGDQFCNPALFFG